MLVQNAKVAALQKPLLKAALAALLPDTGALVTLDEKQAIRTLEKGNPEWKDTLSEAQITALFQEMITEGKVTAVPVATAVEPKVG